MKVEVAEVLLLISLLLLASAYSGVMGGRLVQAGVQVGSAGAGGALWIMLSILMGFGLALVLLFRHPRLYILMVWAALAYSLALSLSIVLGGVLSPIISTSLALFLVVLAALRRGHVRSVVLSLAAGGVGGVAGILLGPLYGALFLLALTAFDMLSVLVTGHMVELGERAIEEGAPVFLEVDAGAGPRYLGLGDVFSVSLPAAALASSGGAQALLPSLLLVVPTALATYLAARALRRPLPATVFLALPQAALLLGWVTAGV